MIIIDGHQSEMQIANFKNLEEILVSILQDNALQDRIITDVLVNEEVFTEIYPHQAEDIGSDFIERLEVRSVSTGKMALDISKEMSTVTEIMVQGSTQIARLFRQADDTEGLELLQDLLDVTRDFMGMIEALRTNCALESSEAITENSAKLSSLLTEMSEVLENEDWILFADLLEYEFLPTCENWKQILPVLQEEIRKKVEG